MTDETDTDRPGTPEPTDEDYRASVREMRSQAEDFRRAASRVDWRLGEAESALRAGWQGESASGVLTALQVSRDGIRSALVSQARDLEEASDNLQARFRARERRDPPASRWSDTRTD